MVTTALPTRALLWVCSLLIVFVAVSGCSKGSDPGPGDNSKEKTAPFVTLTVVGVTTTTSAVVNCEVNSDGGDPVTARGFCWGTKSGPTLADSKTTDGTGTGKFFTTITGLTPGITYYIRAYATNSIGTTYGLEVPFSTLEGPLSTSAVSSITMNTAVAGGYNPTDPTVTSRGVYWSTKPDITLADQKTVEPAGTGSFVSNLTGLNGGTTYYVKAYVVRPTGVFFANTVTFTTPAGLSVLTTLTPSAVRSFSAVAGGKFTNSNGEIIERGLCWSRTSDPTTGDFKVKLGAGDGEFSGRMTKLAEDARYYVRAYAINSAGTAYGPQQVFSTMPTVIDAEGNIYETVKIGSRTWMGSNLRTRKYNNGDGIATTANPMQTNVSNVIFPQYQWPVNGNEANAEVYGRVYTWHVVKDSRQIAPVGWHVATDDDWRQLQTVVGKDAGILLKEEGQVHWNGSGLPSGAGGTTNPFGFSAVGSGIRFGDDTIIFTHFGYFAYWWTTTPYNDPNNGVFVGGREWSMEAGSATMRQTGYIPSYTGLAVRCVKD